jgi:OmcA/MtrC family decaheme c-type cytochrome
MHSSGSASHTNGWEEFMKGFCQRAASLVLAGALALAGCSGSKGDAGAPGGTGPTGPTGPAGPGVSSASTGIRVNVVSVGTTSPITVRFTLEDDRGFPVDLNGIYSVNTVFGAAGSNGGLRFSLAYTTLDANGKVQPYTVLTNSGSPALPTGFSPFASSRGPGVGTLSENGWGMGDYTYTFPDASVTGGAQAVALDPAKLSNTHVLWIQATRQTNLDNADDPRGFASVNQDYWFVPAGGTAVKREVVKTSNCANCHRGFKPGEGSIAATTFHGGAMIEATLCGICHNPGRTTNPAAEAKVYLHRIHNSENLQAANLFHGIEVKFPQDIRNCNACHGGAKDGAQAMSNPTRQACGSCHDYVSFTDAYTPKCTDPVTRDANGLPVPCNHIGGAKADDSACTGCHGATDVASYHVTVAPPDANSIYANPTSTGNSNTNAAWLAAAKAVPAGAKVVTYEVASVDAVPVTNGFNASIKFRFLVDGAPTPMQTYAAGTTEEILAGFVGSPSAYFAFAVPQDGITAPADFNASASAYIRNVWNGVGDAKTTGTTTTGTQGGNQCTVAAPCTCSKASPCLVPAGTISGPDADQYYTLQVTNTLIPTSATMLTGGIGYTYSLGAWDTTPKFIGNTQPLTQIDVPGYAYTANTCTAPATCGGTGGLVVPAPDVWKVANGFVGRRAIVDTAKCQTCHVALGAEPTFHAGQRNDGPTCSFCHTPNRTSSGWSAGSRSYIHAIHGGRVRTVPFNWHAPSATQIEFPEIEFPGPLNNCTACHVDGGFNFSASAAKKTSGTSTTGKQGTTACTVAAPCTCTSSNPCQLTASGSEALPNVLWQTVAQSPSGTVPTYASAGGPNSWTISPYVDVNATYGAGFAFSGATGATTAAAGTTLVNSPITNACTGCHDSPMAIDHMETNGGRFYAVRSNAIAANAPLEQCMICHGPGTVAAIADVHK